MMAISTGHFVLMCALSVSISVQGLVNITIEDNVFEADTSISFYVICDVGDNVTNVRNITVIHERGRAVKTQNNPAVETSGIFQNVRVRYEFDTWTKLVFHFENVSSTTHFGIFTCFVIRNNTSVPENANGNIQLFGRPLLKVNKSEGGIGLITLTCTTPAWCVNNYTVSFFDDTLPLKSFNVDTIGCNATIKDRVHSFNSSVCDIGKSYKFKCSVSYGVDGRKRRSILPGTKFYSSTTVVLVEGVGFNNTCINSSYCRTTFAVCGFKTTGKPICECNPGDIYDRKEDSCTNVVPCPEKTSYIHFKEENSCWALKKVDLSDNWDRICEGDNADGLTMTPTLRTHALARVWTYGMYSSIIAVEPEYSKKFIIVLSTNKSIHASGRTLWFGPNGKELVTDNLTPSRITPDNTDACLYMKYDGPNSIYEESQNCYFTGSEVYKGCFISLPKQFCEMNTDSQGTVWNFTEGGKVETQPCKEGYTGNITRRCTEDGVFQLPFYNCTRRELADITSDLAKTANTTNALEKLRNLVQATSTNTSSNATNTTKLFIGDLLKIQTILVTVANVTVEPIHETKNFFEVANTVVDAQVNGDEWASRIQKEKKGIEDFVAVVDTFVAKATEALSKTNETNFHITKPNIVLQFAAVSQNESAQKNLSFPTSLGNESEWKDTKTSSTFLHHTAFKDQNITAYSVVLYRNLSKSIPNRLENEPNETDVTINSQVISVQMIPKPTKLNPPIEFVFQGFQNMTSFNTHCTYWNLDGYGEINATTESEKGSWATDGCQQKIANSSVVICSCTHLTNFALLISPYVPPEEHQKVLGIISIVGCSISILALLITVGLHACHWRLVKNDSTILLVALCAALIAGNVIFLAGVTQNKNKVGCTSIAVVLHYLFLVAFFLMLAEGVKVFIKIVFVFNKKSYLVHMLTAALGVPAVIVVVSAGVTQLEGYGTEDNCWLSRDTGLFWAFVGPACLVIVLNFVVIGLLARTILKRGMRGDQDVMKKARRTAQALAVVVPLMGVTWIVGVFSVNADSLWLQYIFCIFNGLQGFFIFIFHVVLNKQLKQAMKATKARKQTLDDFASESKSTSFQVELKIKIKARFAKIMKSSTTKSAAETDEKEFSFDNDTSKLETSYDANTTLKDVKDNKVSSPSADEVVCVDNNDRNMQRATELKQKVEVEAYNTEDNTELMLQSESNKNDNDNTGDIDNKDEKASEKTFKQPKFDPSLTP